MKQQKDFKELWLCGQCDGMKIISKGAKAFYKDLFKQLTSDSK